MIMLCKYMPLPQCLGDLGGGLSKAPKEPCQKRSRFAVFLTLHLSCKALSFRAPGCHHLFVFFFPTLKFLSHIPHLYQYLFVPRVLGMLFPQETEAAPS